MTERLTDGQLAELRTIAEAATPGAWEADGLAGNLDSPECRVAEVGMWREVDAEHIAAFDPPTVIALLDEVERLRGLLSAVVDDITTEMNLARQAYRSTQTDHFAHDYCRWVGHAEAYGNALNFIDQNKEAH